MRPLLAQLPNGTLELLRPLLPFPKQRIVERLKQANITWIEDASNHSLKFDRGRIRALQDEVGEDFMDSLSQTVKVLQNLHETSVRPKQKEMQETVALTRFSFGYSIIRVPPMLQLFGDSGSSMLVDVIRDLVHQCGSKIYPPR